MTTSRKKGNSPFVQRQLAKYAVRSADERAPEPPPRRSRRRNLDPDERRERRREQRLSDSYALIDGDEEATLQDHDVEDSGISVRARRSGLPGSHRRRF